MSPAGSLSGCIAAINAGADAVYLGGELFGARAFAKNLSLDELKEAIDYAHLFNRKIYLTVNTLLKNDEIKQKLFDYLNPVYAHGLDGVIVQDLGVIKFIRDIFPDLPVHASTQMTITSYHQAKMLKSLGVERVVPAREISFEETKKIYEETGLEIESFVHGALCYCYSGQCLFSSIIGGRSGNRGRCAGPCRLPYDVFLGEKKVLKEKYPLSPKDICVLELIPELVNSGVCSFKIEGRMKRPEYTAGVTAIYRKYIDLYLSGNEYSVDKRDLETLNTLYSRNDFSRSYYENEAKNKKILKDMISLDAPNYISADDDFMNEIAKKYVDTRLKKKIKAKISISKTSKCSAIIYDDIHFVSFETVPAKEAEKRPLDADTVRKQFNKTGSTNFDFTDIETEVEDNAFLTMGELNDFRRGALEAFENELLKECRRDYVNRDLLTDYLTSINESIEKINTKFADEINDSDFANNGDIKVDCKTGNKDTISISLGVSNEAQLKLGVNSFAVSRIYLNLSAYKDDLKSAVKIIKEHGDKEIYISLPRIYRARFDSFIKEFLDGEIVQYIDGIMLGSLEYYNIVNEYIEKSGKNATILERLNYIFDNNVYAFNDLAAGALISFDGRIKRPELSAAVEVNKKELIHMACKADMEVQVYGLLPLMISEGCILNTAVGCKAENFKEVLRLKDRKNNMFPVERDCKLCLNTIYNCKTLNLISEIMPLKANGFNSFRIDLLNESAEDTKSLLAALERVNVGEEADFDIPDFTRGHFKRGVD